MSETNGSSRPGFIMISRKAYESNPFWLERRKFSRWEAWEDLIQITSFASHRWAVPGAAVVQLARGETHPLSRSFLATRWLWSEHKVRNYLGLLEKMGQIRPGQGTAQGTTYHLVNYEIYQTPGPGKGTGNGTAEGRARAGAGPGEGRKENKGNKGNKGNNESTTADPAFNLAAFLDAWKASFDALPTNPGLLGALLKPVVSTAGHDKTILRWGHFVAGIRTTPQYFGSEAKQFQRFAATPAAYDDPDWYLSDRQKADDAKLFDGLYG